MDDRQSDEPTGLTPPLVSLCHPSFRILARDEGEGRRSDQKSTATQDATGLVATFCGQVPPR
jgi:hypothetical protein